MKIRKSLRTFLRELHRTAKEKRQAVVFEEIKYNNGLSFVELSPIGQKVLTKEDMEGLKKGRHFTPDGVRGLAFHSTKKVYVFDEMIIHSDALKKMLPSYPRSVKESFTNGMIFPFIAAFTPNGQLEDIGDLFSPENFDPDNLKKRLNAIDAKGLAQKMGEHWSWLSFVFPGIKRAFVSQIVN